MAQRYAVSYFGSNAGSIMYNERSFTKGKKVTSFGLKISCPNGFPHTSPTSGDVVGNKCRTPVYGAIWLSPPSDAYDAPDYLSTNSVNLANGYRFSRNTDAPSSSVPATTFNFNDAICNQSTIYVGLYTPYDKAYNTVIAFVGDDDITLHRSFGTSMGTWSNHGLYFTSFSTADPYTAPKLKVNSYTNIGKLDSTNYNVNYTITKGTNSIQDLHAVLLPYLGSGWNPIWEKAYNRNSSGQFNDTYQLNASNGFKDGSRYSMKMYLYDGKTSVLSPGEGFKTSDAGVVYTYRQPTINSSVTIATNPQNANTSNTFTIQGINNRAWSDFEETFQTHYRIKLGADAYKDWVNLNNISSWTRTAAQMRTLVPKQYDAATITIQFRRYNPSAQLYSGNAQNTFKVYYRPRVGIAQASFRENNASGTVISANSWVKDDSDLSNIYISWNYDTSIANAGYTQGYRIRLYNKDNVIVKTYYSDNKYYSIPKKDIPRLQQTYIDITPYYKNDSTDVNSYWYFNGDIVKINFIKIYSDLNKPVITYPVNNSNWINERYRIAFKLPADSDFSAVEGTYKYKNIEIQINNNYTIRMADTTGITTSGTNILNTNCFSSLLNNLTYQKGIVCCPFNTGSLPINSTYTIRLRVQKNYASSTWSPWSDTVTIKVTNIQIPSYENQYILASHYNYMRDTISRMINTYMISWPNDPKAASNNIIISKNRYSYNNVVDRLNAIKNIINNYTTFDNTINKFDVDNILPNSFDVNNELITALEKTESGANYLITILQRCELLK